MRLLGPMINQLSNMKALFLSYLDFLGFINGAVCRDSDLKVSISFLKLVFGIFMPLHGTYNQCPPRLGSGTSQLVATNTPTQHELQQLTTQVMVKSSSTLVLGMRVSPRKWWIWSSQCYMNHSLNDILDLPSVICTTLQRKDKDLPSIMATSSSHHSSIEGALMPYKKK